MRRALPSRAILAKLLLQAIQPRAQPRQRRAQIMRDIVADAFHFAEQPLDLVEHRVDDAGQHVEFIAVATHRQAACQIAAA
jgi:hypothetical protein